MSDSVVEEGVSASGALALQNGDIVVHPSRPWPWIGVVQGKFCSTALCGCCGSKQHPFILVPTQPKPDTSVPEDGDSATGQSSSVPNHVEPDTAEVCQCGSMSVDEPFIDCDTYEAPTNCSKETQTNDPNWQIVWHPTLEQNSSDGTEKVVNITRKRFYQDGQSVQRADSNRKGIIKGVVQVMDALVLPECKYVVTRLMNSSRVETLQDLETATAGRYIIYKGWLAAVYSIWSRVNFRMADGTEFWLADNDQEMSLHCTECLVKGREVPVETFQMFPGMRVDAPHLILEKAHFQQSDYKLSDELERKMAASKAEWNVKEMALEAGRNGHLAIYNWSVDSPKRKTGAPADLLGKQTDSCDQDSNAELEIAAEIVIEEEPMAKNKKENSLELTVVRVDQVKMDVEWRCQVSGSEPQPESSYLDEEQIKEAQHFRVPISFLSYKGIGSRFRYELKPTDRVITVEQWRQELLENDQEVMIDLGRPKSGETAYLYQLTSKCFVDILWEEGETETEVPADQLVHSSCLDASRDYFPAMYVLLESKSAPDSGAKDQFGLVLRSCNTQKFANVQWYKHAFDSEGNKCKGGEPSKLEQEEISFYDLRSHPDFNYLTGTLVAKHNAQPSDDRPNLGYVVQKLPDGMVSVRWFGAETDAVEKPWHLYKLRVDSQYQDSEYTVSDLEAGGQYSPTEHEWDELEDFRYYDYTNIAEPERWQRIGLLAELLTPGLALLQHMLLITHKEYPLVERRQLMRLALHCDDVVAGFAIQHRFESLLKQMYKDKMGVEAGNNETLGCGQSNWMYDWLEVTNELSVAVTKHNNKKKKQSTDAEMPLVQSNGECNDLIVANGPMEEDGVDCSTSLSTLLEWINSIQTCFTTVSQVLTQTQLPEVTASLVWDCVANMRQQLLGASHTLPPSEFNPDDLPSEEDLKAAMRFVKCFQKNSKKMGRLPCFSYCMPPENELQALAAEWNIVPLSEESQSLLRVQKDSGNKSVVELMRKASATIESMQEDSQRTKFASDEIVPLVQEIADALSLSCVLLLRAVVSVVRSEVGSFSSALLSSHSANAANAEDGGRKRENSSSLDTAAEDLDAVLCASSFEMVEHAPTCHRFIAKGFDSTMLPKAFMSAVRRELKLLRSALPPGIVVKSFEDRMDLFSCLMVGPEGTPYAYGLYCFDVRLKDDYPTRPPHVFFRSMSKRLNPNLYEDGMVCLSLLGTWDGKATELWTANSTLLQVFLSIQSLVLVPEPYYNEPGYEKDKGSEVGDKKSREYNESAILLSLESLERIIDKPPEPFVAEIKAHFLENAPRLLKLLSLYQCPDTQLAFPLHPVTQGFCLCIRRHMDKLERLLERLRGQQ